MCEYSFMRGKIKSILVLIAIWIVTISLVKSESTTEDLPNKTNVLWIYLEDVSGWFGCYGDELIKTPHIDDLAESGIRFDRFYVPAAVCSPTRSAIITGMMQTSIGAHHHRSARSEFRKIKFEEYDRNDLPSDVVPLPILFRNAGYYTFNEGGKDDYNFEWHPEEFYDYSRSEGGWGPKSFLSGDCLKGNTENKPFFGQIQLGGGKLRNLPKSVDRTKVSVPPYYPDIPEIREEIAYHYDSLLKTDQQVGQIIDYLKSSGLYENTVILMFSDHGMRLHRHKQFLYEGGIHMPFVIAGKGIRPNQATDRLVSGIDIATTSLGVAGLELPSSMEGQNILAKGWKGREYVIATRDRCDYSIDKIRAVITQDFKYLRNYLTDRPYMQPNYKDKWAVSKELRKMMANGEMNKSQLVFFGDERPAEELYDLSKDPHELINLADDSEYKQVLEKHRELLATWIEKTGDRGQQPESEIGLRCVLERWGERCTNPEYQAIRKNFLQ